MIEYRALNGAILLQQRVKMDELEKQEREQERLRAREEVKQRKVSLTLCAASRANLTV